MFFFWGQEPDVQKPFSERLDEAYRGSSSTPEKIHGRNVWIADRLREMGTPVAPESVRKWFAGATHPRGETLANLARILGVSEQWLETGSMVGAATDPGPRREIDVEDEARLFDPGMTVEELGISDWLRERERAENVSAAGLVSARLRFAGLRTRTSEDRVLVEGGMKSREVAVAILHKAANKGGMWLARLPEQNSGFPPLTASFDILVFVLPRGGREPYLFPILGVAASRLGAGGAMVEITEEGSYDEPVLTMKTQRGTPVQIKPMLDLAGLERLAS